MCLQLDEVTDISQLTAEISALQTEIDCVLEKAAAKKTKRLLDNSGNSALMCLGNLIGRNI